MWAQVAVTGVLLFAVNSILQVEFPVYEKGLIVISGASSGIGEIRGSVLPAFWPRPTTFPAHPGISP